MLIDDLVNEGCDAADSGDQDRAIVLFKRAIQEGAPWVGRNLGNSFLSSERYEEAASAFRTAWVDGNDNDSGLNLGVALERLGRLEEAHNTYEELIARGYPKALINDAMLLRDIHRSVEARELLTQAQTFDNPIGDRAAGVLGVWIWQDDADPKVEPLLRRGLDEEGDAAYALSELLQSTQRFAEAKAVLRRRHWSRSRFS